MPIRSRLAELLDALVTDESEAVRIVSGSPDVARARVVEERFAAAIGHQLYAGDTALHLAAAAVRPLVVQALIEAGADATAENRRRAIALHYACDGRPATRAWWTPSSQCSVIAQLIDAGSDLEHRERAGATPLHRAARARNPDAVRCLLDRGARPNAPHGRQGSTPLHLATRSTGASGTAGAHAEQRAIIDLLLEHGADPRAVDAKGTPTGGRRA